MTSSRKTLTFVLALLTAVTLACSTASIPGLDQGPPATATPVGDYLTLEIPAFTASLAAGELVGGARLEYLGKSPDGGYRVAIDGQEVVKRSGDSLIWSGVIGPGVLATLNLRVTTSLLGELPVAGSVKLHILYPEALELTAVPQLPNALYFSNIVINYSVPAGQTIPGTTLVYAGLTQQAGIDVAQISNGSRQTYHAVGDSLVWAGKLRDNVYARYNLRIISFDEATVQVGGLAEIWIEK
ncbi:MAG TPA: hypothetical protein EYP41_10475 [Anaerolineae bacterium]|nr:hypothetical protein [Anaerolineae bacterium]HIP71698.1 hypothetical protein [Anaerolineae bacterium]